MKPGEIWFGQFPFGGRVGAKIRPVLIVSDPLGSVPEYIVAFISSSLPATMESSDLLLDPSTPDHACTNLKKLSVLRLHKISTIHQRDLLRKSGDLPAAMRPIVSNILRSEITI